jgi:hypothetical protein
MDAKARGKIVYGIVIGDGGGNGGDIGGGGGGDSDGMGTEASGPARKNTCSSNESKATALSMPRPSQLKQYV